MLAVEKEELKVVRKLLARNDILVNKRDSRGMTAIHRAASTENPGIMEALVASPSIDLKPRYGLGHSPLIKAAMTGNLPALTALLEAGADVNIRESELEAGGNALMRAADYDHVAIVHKLIKSGVDWNAKDGYERSAIHSAAINGNPRSLTGLLDLPVIDINVQDFNGNTPLHDAASLGSTESLEVLVKKGAITDIRNNRGKTPLDVARVGTEVQCHGSRTGRPRPGDAKGFRCQYVHGRAVFDPSGLSRRQSRS